MPTEATREHIHPGPRRPAELGKLLRPCPNCGALAFVAGFGLCDECAETTDYGREHRARTRHRRTA